MNGIIDRQDIMEGEEKKKRERHYWYFMKTPTELTPIRA